jgi:hypothetical protein
MPGNSRDGCELASLTLREKAETLLKAFEHCSTTELISILRKRDEEEWRPEAFEAVAQVLQARGVSPEEMIATEPEGVDSVRAESMVTIARFFSSAQAHVSRMALEAAGLEAWVADEAGGTMYGVGVGTRLQVRGQDADAAREVLSAAPTSAEDLPPEMAEPPCPACGSRNVISEAWVDDAEEPEALRRATRRKWYYVCNDCEEEWPA